jgi:hypothetical protein
MRRPALSDVTTTLAVGVNAAEYDSAVSADTATMAPTRATAAILTAARCETLLITFCTSAFQSESSAA